MPTKTKRTFLALSFAIIVLGGCKTSMDIRPVADLPAGVAGIWESNGYGYVLDATREYPRLFHHTPEFCIEDEENATVLSHYLTDENLTYGNNGRSIYFSPTLEDYPIELNAISKLPQTCGLELASDAVTVFESFASYMDTHYAFFDLYNVDWKMAVARARSDVFKEMSDAQLFDVLSNLLRPLKDGHIELNAEIKGEEKTFEPGLGTLGEALDRIAARDGVDRKKLNNKMLTQYWVKGVRKDILQGDGKLVANDTIQYGIVSDDIGYIAIVIEGGYADKGLSHEADDLAVLQDTLDDAISLFNTTSAKSVIIDLSVNFGGYDFISREIAERFATRPSLAYTKYAADSTLRTPFEVSITPYSGDRYVGPVILVTSNVTLSAGEMLTMALRTQPNVTHVGETTRGAHSDVLEKKLPNGWTLALSNEVFHDHEGNFWEDRGIPPHVPLQIFNPENPFEGHVTAINEIIDRIDTGKFQLKGRE